MDLDSALLRAFVVVADEGHFGRAGSRLAISQQAVSKRIARLEAALATPLFTRGPGPIGLTEAGRRLLPQARSIVEGVDRAVAAARPDSRPLRLDVLNEHLAMLHFVAELVDSDPGTPVETVMRQHLVDAVTQLRSGAADVAFGRAGAVGSPGEPWPQDVQLGPVFLEPFGLLLGAAHPWAARDAVLLTELFALDLWFPMTGAPQEWVDLLDELRADYGLTIDYAGATMGFDRFVGRALAGGGTFYGLGMPPPPSPDVRVVPIVDPVPVFPWFAMWRRRLPPAARAVAEAVVTRARAATPEPHPDDAWMPLSDRRLLPSC